MHSKVGKNRIFDRKKIQSTPRNRQGALKVILLYFAF